MCDSSAYLLTGDIESLLLEHIDFFEISGDDVLLVDIFGEEKRFRARIIRLALLDHRIYFEPLG